MCTRQVWLIASAWPILYVGVIISTCYVAAVTTAATDFKAGILTFENKNVAVLTLLKHPSKNNPHAYIVTGK